MDGTSAGDSWGDGGGVWGADSVSAPGYAAQYAAESPHDESRPPAVDAVPSPAGGQPRTGQPLVTVHAAWPDGPATEQPENVPPGQIHPGQAHPDQLPSLQAVQEHRRQAGSAWVRPGGLLADHRRRRVDVDPNAWPVGFSPTGESLPETLTDVLLRGSHAIRSFKRAEAQRRERAAAIAAHVEAQIEEFLALCAAENLVPPVVVRAVRRPPGSGSGHRDGRPRAILRADAAVRQASSKRRRLPRRRERLRAWPLLYWRCESFPSAGRSLHLFVEPGGRTFEGRETPAPLAVVGREVQVWPVDAPSIVEGMAEVDARRCALQLVHGMAHLLWQAGVGL